MATTESHEERINKLLALRLGIARREADELIAKKRVQVDGKPAALGQRIHDNSRVTVDGKPLETSTVLTYLALHKPAGYVCSRRRQGDTPTIYELLPERYHNLKLVGRLDKDSSGIILLTNDGDFAHQMTHPKFHKIKLYEVELDIPLQPLHRQMISDFGVILEDGKSQFQLERLHEGDDHAWRITMSEGRNRQIRRTFASLGYAVAKLHRTQFGPYRLDQLSEGATATVDHQT
ncbi:MAG TPA: pseudouridine synthase [Candidatus Saccharimonadales bacterium]